MLHHCSSKLFTKILDFGAIRSPQALQYNKWAYRLTHRLVAVDGQPGYTLLETGFQTVSFTLFIVLKKNVNWLLNNRLFAKQHNMERKGRPEEVSPVNKPNKHCAH